MEEEYTPSFMEETPRTKPISDEEFDDVLNWLGLNSYSDISNSAIQQAHARVQGTISYNMNKPLTGSFSDPNQKFSSSTFNRPIGTITKYKE
jgi:hypothetical protein